MREARISVVNSVTAHIRNEEWDAILNRAKERIRSVGRNKPDLVLLAEIFGNHPAEMTMETVAEAAQTVPGPITEELSALAGEFGTYIAFGLLRRDGERFYNSLVLLDRKGKPVWTYDKVSPMAAEMVDGGISPGAKPSSFDCDFGRVGGAICFDINFAELGEFYWRQNTELLLFSSAFPAGKLLDHWAVRYGFAVAGSTWYADNRIIDCTGAVVGRTSDILPYTTTVMNLNRRVVHMDYNLEKIDRMLSRYAGDVLVEDMRDEAVCMITSLKPGLEVADLIQEFEVETLPDYLDRNRRVRQEHGGMAVPIWS
ncbi:MAG: carbon-nitrogen hydrolase family protein [bacterium]|nr:carbon-nitrogen hydrolase family protein [bacterium]